MDIAQGRILIAVSSTVVKYTVVWYGGASSKIGVGTRREHEDAVLRKCKLQYSNKSERSNVFGADWCGRFIH
jgi:hypothetical protein